MAALGRKNAAANSRGRRRDFIDIADIMIPNVVTRSFFRLEAEPFGQAFADQKQEQGKSKNK
jgi:hypothetical protein